MDNTTSAIGSHNDIESLCQSYCPPLEAGLVYALAGDYNLSDLGSLRELQAILDGLKESAVIEQDLELLPQNDDRADTQNAVSKSALNKQPMPGSYASPDQSVSSIRSTTEEDGVTSITTGISGLKSSEFDESDLEQAFGYGDAAADFEKLSDEDKYKRLGNMFPNVQLQIIQEVFARCSGDFERTTDELLNVSFLNESNENHGNQEYSVPKGIDGFLKGDTEGSQPPIKNKGKGRGRKNRNVYIDSSEPMVSDSGMSSGAATLNTGRNLPEDVEFIASRTHLKPKHITTVYHANGARLAPTIRALTIKAGEPYNKASHKVDEIIEWQIEELRIEYGNVSNTQIYGALMLADKIPSAANELIEAMTLSNEQPVLLGKVTGLASYTPVNLSEDETNPKKKPARPLSGVISANSGVYTTSHLTNTHGLAASQAFQQASSAYKRGKSDHLMGGAAAYYASVGHERIQAAKALQASAADAHVAAQSSPSVLDLHGVNVSDAVRIAQKGTEAWWENLGDRKYVVGGKGDGYRIVTGVGRHSADGIGRIGPAVSKMLVREGWRVEIGRGEVVVSGRARR